MSPISVSYTHLGIVGDGDAAIRLALLLQVSCQAGGGAAHGIEVHAVGARPEDAAHTGGAEFQKAVKAVAERGFILRQRLQLPGKLRQRLLPLGIMF